MRDSAAVTHKRAGRLCCVARRRPVQVVMENHHAEPEQLRNELQAQHKQQLQREKNADVQAKHVLMDHCRRHRIGVTLQCAAGRMKHFVESLTS